MPNNNEQYKGKGALDAFLNLLSLITVGWSAIALGMILFQIVNKFFAGQGISDCVGSIDCINGFSQMPLKFGIASVVILTPVFLAVAAWLHHNYKVGKLNHDSGIHRWLTYLMLLVSALTIIGRLIYQLFRFLDGDWVTVVILKTLVILIIAGGILGYYLYELMRKDFNTRSVTSLMAFVLVIVVAIASVIGGFLIIDSPARARALKFDLQRVDNLSNLSSVIYSYYIDNKKLPTDLSASPFNNFHDPETNQPYEYRIVSSDQYELCAIFSLATSQISGNYVAPTPIGFDFFYHKAGRQCFIKSVQYQVSTNSQTQ